MRRLRPLYGIAAFGLFIACVAASVTVEQSSHVQASTSRASASSPARLISTWDGKMTMITVSDVAGLNAAVKNASGGETILLLPGTYSGMAFKSPTFDLPITITSADPSNPAIVTDFGISKAKGITFSKLEFATQDHPDLVAAGTSYWAFRVINSSDIHFDQVSFHGSLNGDASDDIQGLQIRLSENVSVTNSEFQQLQRALAIGQTKNVAVTDNYAHHLRSDGFDFAEVGFVRVTGNTLHHFTPVGSDHPDAIQFWTTGTKTPSHDILIANNLIMKGDGAYTQGIFVTDQLHTLPYERLTIADNLIVGTGYNGIRVVGAKDLTLTNNQLVSFAGENKTWFLVQEAKGVVATDNSATSISFTGSTNVTLSNNVVSKFVADFGEADVKKWLAENPDHAAMKHIDALPIDWVIDPMRPGPLTPPIFVNWQNFEVSQAGLSTSFFDGSFEFA